jgi:hypothetical protein
MTRLGKRASTALCVATAIVLASAASARTERFRWTQSGTVDNFKLYWGTASGAYSSSLNVGVPAKDSTGAYFYDLVVPDASTIYVAVTSWSGGLESPKSNERSRAGTSGTPPPPPPPPPPSSSKPNAPIVTASGTVVHVAPATNGAAHTGGWITVYPYNSSGGGITLADPVSGGGFPRDLNLSPYFSEALSAVRIEVEGCASNAAGYTCSARVNVPRTALPPPSVPLGAPGQPYIVP